METDSVEDRKGQLPHQLRLKLFLRYAQISVVSFVGNYRPDCCVSAYISLVVFATNFIFGLGFVSP